MRGSWFLFSLINACCILTETCFFSKALLTCISDFATSWIIDMALFAGFANHQINHIELESSWNELTVRYYRYQTRNAINNLYLLLWVLRPPNRAMHIRRRASIRSSFARSVGVLSFDLVTLQSITEQFTMVTYPTAASNVTNPSAKRVTWLVTSSIPTIPRGYVYRCGSRRRPLHFKRKTWFQRASYCVVIRCLDRVQDSVF